MSSSLDSSRRGVRIRRSRPSRLGHCVFPCARCHTDASSPRGSGSHLIPEQRVERDLQEVTRGGQDGTGRYYFHSSADSAALLEESLSSAGSGMRDAAPASEALMLICCFLTWIRARGGIRFLRAACTVHSHWSVRSVGITRPFAATEAIGIMRGFRKQHVACASAENVNRRNFGDFTRKSPLKTWFQGFWHQVKKTEYLSAELSSCFPVRHICCFLFHVVVSHSGHGCLYRRGFLFFCTASQKSVEVKICLSRNPHFELEV